MSLYFPPYIKANVLFFEITAHDNVLKFNVQVVYRILQNIAYVGNVSKKIL